jgi:cell division protein FtsB
MIKAVGQELGRRGLAARMRRRQQLLSIERDYHRLETENQELRAQIAKLDAENAWLGARLTEQSARDKNHETTQR